jgi:hypothetical protein
MYIYIERYKNVHTSYLLVRVLCILVQWFSRLLPVMRTWVQSPGWYLCETGILLLACLATLMTPTCLIIVALSEAGFVPNRH